MKATAQAELQSDAGLATKVSLQTNRETRAERKEKGEVIPVVRIENFHMISSDNVARRSVTPKRLSYMYARRYVS